MLELSFDTIVSTGGGLPWATKTIKTPRPLNLPPLKGTIFGDIHPANLPDDLSDWGLKSSRFPPRPGYFYDPNRV